MLLGAQELLGRGGVPSREEIKAHLTGNYCRCTGYQAIIDAVEAVARERLGPRASRPLPEERAGGETDHKAASASSPPPGGGRSARVSGPGGGDSAAAHAASLSSPALPSPHPGSPTAIRPSPFRGGLSSPLDEERAGRPRSQRAP
jgi:hypothetical protein